jgi:hypothetical protein
VGRHLQAGASLNGISTRNRLVVGLPLAGLLLVLTAPVAQGATPPCRVRNLAQDTFGRSLIRMTEKAEDGDRLRVRGTCPGTVVIHKDLTIVGVDNATLTGRGRTRVVRVKRGAIVTIRHVTIQRGAGGGILNEGRLTLEDVLVRRNRGGGIHNHRRMVITGSTIRYNSAGRVYSGGGILNSGILHIAASTIKRNSSGAGGGVLNNYGARVTLSHSTVSDNYSGYRGGGIYNGDPASGSGGETVTLIGTTVTGNRARYGGGGIGTSDDCGGNVIIDETSTISGNSPDDFPDAGSC